jgi:hypothetical protein
MREIRGKVYTVICVEEYRTTPSVYGPHGDGKPKVWSMCWGLGTKGKIASGSGKRDAYSKSDRGIACSGCINHSGPLAPASASEEFDGRMRRGNGDA